MKTFKTYLLENKSQSDINGKIHEVLVAKHLNGGQHVSQEAETLHKQLIDGMSKERADDENAKAKFAADNIKQKVGHLGIKRVGIVSKPGDIKRFTNGKHDLSQREDASDIMIQHSDGSYSGHSLKSSVAHNAKVGFHNEGHQAVDSRLGVNTKHHLTDMKQKIMNQHHELVGMSDSALKAYLKKHEDIAKTAEIHGKVALANIANDWHSAYKKMSSVELAKHLRHVLHAQKPVIDHYRSTTSGANGKFQNHIIQPGTHHDQYIDDHENISVRRQGNSGIMWTHTDPKTGKITHLANERAKFVSGPATSVKTSVN